MNAASKVFVSLGRTEMLRGLNFISWHTLDVPSTKNTYAA